MAYRRLALLIVGGMMAIGWHGAHGLHAVGEEPSRTLRLLVCGQRTAIVSITPEHRDGVVEWTYPASSREGWVLPDGAVKTAFPLACQKVNAHMQTRMARKQFDGSFLVPHLLDFAIIRYGADGAVLSTIDTHVSGEPKINSWPFTVIALADGGILAALTNGNRVVEFAADGSVRWQVTAADTDEAINDACGVQRLPNGNTMIASYRIGKNGVRLLEVSPEKEVVWSWKANVPAVHHFHVIETEGGAVAFPALR